MNYKVALHQTPVPSTDFAVDADLCGSVLRYEYFREGVLYRSAIRFKMVLATRTRAERCCKTWHVESAYDTLIEVVDSPWVEELRADTNKDWRNEWEMHHYMIYLDSAGCFEVVAESWDAIREEPGSWESV